MLKFQQNMNFFADKKLNSIQILRAIAALVVVFYHTNFALVSFDSAYIFKMPFLTKYGYFGIDLFFVISGFIIIHITSDKPFDTFSFLTKRFFRIYPLYFVLSAFSYYSYLKYGQSLGGPNPSLNTFISSIAIFPLQEKPVFGVGWTLEHEMIFYVITAFILSFGKKRHLMMIMGLTGLIGLIFEILYKTDVLAKVWDYQLFSPYNLCFLGGMLTYQYRKKFSQLNSFLLFLMSALVFSLSIQMMLSPVAMISLIARFVGVGLGCILLVLGSLNLKETSNVVLNYFKKIFIEIGNASYSLYLVHWLLVTYAGDAKLKNWLNIPDWAAELWRYGWIAISVLASIATYHLFEKFFIRYGTVALKKRQIKEVRSF